MAGYSGYLSKYTKYLPQVAIDATKLFLKEALATEDGERFFQKYFWNFTFFMFSLTAGIIPHGVMTKSDTETIAVKALGKSMDMVKKAGINFDLVIHFGASLGLRCTSI